MAGWRGVAAAGLRCDSVRAPLPAASGREAVPPRGLRDLYPQRRLPAGGGGFRFPVCPSVGRRVLLPCAANEPRWGYSMANLTIGERFRASPILRPAGAEATVARAPGETRRQDDALRATDRTGAKMDEVPVVREPVRARVFAHGRNENAIAEGNVTNSKRLKKLGHRFGATLDAVNSSLTLKLR